jgi:alpha-mannosidase
MEARVPLPVAKSRMRPGHLPPAQNGLNLSRKGVMVTAFGEDPDGNPGTLLRLWEQAGVSGELAVTLPRGLRSKTATPVDLRGQKSGLPFSVADNTLRISPSAYAPASFVLQ